MSYFGDDYDEDEEYYGKPMLVDRSVDVEKIKKEFQKTKKLLNDNSVLETKLKEIEKKVQEYRNQLLKEISDLTKTVKGEYKDTFGQYPKSFGDGTRDGSHFYHMIAGFHFSDKSFDKFLENLEKNYGQKFEHLTFTSKSTKQFEEFEHGSYDTYYVQKHYCVSLIVPSSMKEIIEHKYKNIKESDLKTLCKQENIFLLANDWCELNGWHQKDIFAKSVSLSKVFDHLDDYNIKTKKSNEWEEWSETKSLYTKRNENAIKIDSSKNLYYKDDERFENTIFETLNFYNEEVKKEDAKENREMLKNYKKQIERDQKRYQELEEEIL